VSVLEDKLKLLPDKAGVYVMLDSDCQIIYVGKAKNLKNRVRQYFHASVKNDKTMAMVSHIADFYYYIAPSEIDALSLENTLIKKHKPRYNILLKDDKTYPYLKINLREKFPTFTITRKIKKDGAKYFGPYMSGVSVSGVLEMVNLVFGVRPCDKKLDKPLSRPCLNYHVKKCSAPCLNYIDESEYGERVKNAINFLNGDTGYAETVIKDKMTAHAEREEFELALKYKELLLSVEKIKLKRITTLNRFISADVIAYESNGLYSAVSVLFVRNGIMMGGKNFSFENASFSDGEAVLEFISRYYQRAEEIPSEILVGVDIADGEVVENYLNERRGEKTKITQVKIGAKKSLIDMAQENAREHLNVALTRIEHKLDMTVNACARLKDLLGLNRYPKRMECYDISNVSGVDKVGSMVVFNDGEPERSSYRRFKIKSFEGADDYRSHQEMMRRRLEKLRDGDEKFPKPDLIIIDGGKGQLSAVKQVFDEYGVIDIDLIALAEKEEDVYTLFNDNPIKLDHRDYSLKVLQRIRDEAHRFAITYHRSLRSKRALSSVLDDIQGLGKVRIRALLDKFKDVSGIMSATEEELTSVKGIGKTQAKLIREKLTEEGLI